jgi:hypothetical protein
VLLRDVVLQLIQFVDLRRECSYDIGKLVLLHYRKAVWHIYRGGVDVSVCDAV